MRTKNRFSTRPLLLAAALLLAPVVTAQEQEEEVVRISSELVQTDVSVFDKSGKFVDGLRPEQFELQVDGKTQPINFFERVRAGSRSEAAQLSALASRRPEAVRTAGPNQTADAEEAGRLIFFFVDDLHLSPASTARARTALQHYVDKEMGPNDQAAVVSASGQVGFLQQLTDNPAVLRAAIGRLGYRGTTDAYSGKTQISEYEASQVLDSGNRELYAYLLESTKIEQQMGPGNRHGDHRLAASYSAAPVLRNRLRQVRAQGRMATAGTLETLRGLMRSAGALPGRKLVFFLSDGFILNERAAGAIETLRDVTAAAAQSGVVVYTMSLRASLFPSGSGIDATSNAYVDLTARRIGVDFGEVSATKEPLLLIAEQTGGRAVFNSDDIGETVRQAVGETADYYLLAWRPDSSELRESGARLKVSVKGHPEWRVRLRAASFNVPAVVGEQPKPPGRTAAATENVGEAKAADSLKTAEAKPDDGALLSALGALYPLRELPVAVSAGYQDTGDQGTVLNISMQLGRAAFDFDSKGEKAKTLVDVAGAAIDDRGQFGSFKQLLTVTPETAGGDIVWHQRLRLKPGLYQVRVAVRERATGRAGSATQWVEIPDLSKGDFALSSIFLGERAAQAAPAAREAEAPRPVSVAVDRRFTRASVLRFQTYVYNAARAGGADGREVQLQAQVFRGPRPVITTQTFKVPAAPDLARLPFWSELSLEQLTPGRYVLQVTATDLTTKRTAVERVGFYVD